MEIRVLQYFMAVARHENITKAAEELHLTQPTLSRQLSDLEDELGMQLLVRGKRKTQLTEAGLIFKARAQEILRLTEKTKEQFAKMDELVAGGHLHWCRRDAGDGLCRESPGAAASLLSSHPVPSGQRQ